MQANTLSQKLAALGMAERGLCTELFAQIKASSKYAWQDKALFAVEIAPCSDGYVVRGGVGGRYRLSDVDLYAKTDGEIIKIT